MEFAPFRDADLSSLRWTRIPGAGHTFHLVADDTTLASLVWDKPRSSRAVAATSEGRLTLKRAGFLHAHLTVRREGSDQDIARLVIAWREHGIELRGGETFDLKRASMLVPDWTVSDARTRERLFDIEPVREGSRLEGGIYEVDAPARSLATLPLLVILSWYFVVLAWFEDETVAEWADHAEGRF